MGTPGPHGCRTLGRIFNRIRIGMRQKQSNWDAPLPSVHWEKRIKNPRLKRTEARDSGESVWFEEFRITEGGGGCQGAGGRGRTTRKGHKIITT